MNIWIKNLLEYNRKKFPKTKIFMIRLDIKKAYDSVVHSILTNRYLKEGWNSNLLKILIKCKR